MFCCYADFFFKIGLCKKIVQQHYQSVINLDPDQDRLFDRPDLSPNCFQRLSADNKAIASKERVKMYITRSRLFTQSGHLFKQVIVIITCLSYFSDKILFW